MLVNHFLEYYARSNADFPCLTRQGETLTYADVEQRCNQLANGLLALGVKKGERIAVLAQNSLEHLLMFMAAGKTGAVTVPLNYRLAPAELAFILSDSKVKVLLAPDPELAATLDGLRPQLAGDTTILGFDGEQDTVWQDWLAGQSHMHPGVDVCADDAYLQLYTSGTTGNPKGVVITHQNILTLCTMNTALTPVRGGPGMADVVCAPLFHIGGAGSVITSVVKGTHIVLHRAFDPAAVVDDIEKFPVNSIFMVPAMIMAVLNLPDIEKRDFSGLKQVFYGASPISEAILRRALEIFDAEFVQMYGMTETAGTVVNLSPADHRKALEGRPELLKSCGRPSVGAEAKVMDGDGVKVPRGEIGEIWLKSETNMRAYYNLTEETAKCLTDGWVHTGDAGYMDEEGYLYLKDRIKDMVVSGGENIYPVEVENAIAHHDAVEDVAVIGVPDKKFGEALLAFIVLRPDATLGLEELIDFCRDRIAGYKIPRRMEIIEELPRNPSGKILKKELRRPYWEGTDRAIG